MELFKQISKEQGINPDNVRAMPIHMWVKDWNDTLLDKTSEEHIKSVEEEFEPLGVPEERKSRGMRR